MSRAETNTRLIKQEAYRLGFMQCGIAAAKELTEDAHHLEQWLKKGLQAGMGYMERHFDLRIDPRKLVPGAKSVITVLLNYFPEQQQSADTPAISKYAFGTDYHYVIREKLNQLLAFIRVEIGAVEGRGFVDSAPVLERAWARESGLGWMGKNANLLHPKSGSFFFIATLICDLELAYDHPFQSDHCGTCTRCIDACPTQAIIAPGAIDSNRCISYLTIESKAEQIPETLQEQMKPWAFGCDICQDVCPWNRFSKAHTEDHFRPIPEVLHLSRSEWESLSEAEFKRIFKSSPILRAKWKGMRRNLGLS
jgi:epoxyqueuosine reductase